MSRPNDKVRAGMAGSKSGDSVRVAYVVKRYPRYSETFIVNEILAHEAAGLPIEIFSIRPPVDTHFQDVIAKVRAPVHYLPSSGSKASQFWATVSSAAQRNAAVERNLQITLGQDPGDVLAAIALAEHALRSGITHFHAHFATSAADVAWMAHHFTGIPFTMTAHAKDIFHQDIDRASLARKLIDAKATVTVSDFNVRYLCDRYPDVQDKIVRIYNGLDLESFPFSAPIDRPPVILGVGRLVEKKGFDVLIDACRLLVDRGVRFQARIIGDGGQRAALMERVERQGVQGHVQFLGPMPQESVKAAVQDAAVLAAPCVEGIDGNRDGLPTVLLESMALGTPCVSTPVTGIPEALINEQTGLLVDQRDPHGLADAITRLLADGDLAVTLAKAARDHVETAFDIHRNAAIQREWFGNEKAAQPTRAAGKQSISISQHTVVV